MTEALLVTKLADALQERGRKAGSGEALFFDRFNLERVISETLAAADGRDTPPPPKGATMIEKPLTGLWRDNPETPEGKYLVKRRDGSVVEWPNFVVGAKDPAAPAALLAYAAMAEGLGFNAKYVAGVRRLAEDFAAYRETHGEGDPDRGRHREDDPATVAEMRRGGSA